MVLHKHFKKSPFSLIAVFCVCSHKNSTSYQIDKIKKQKPHPGRPLSKNDQKSFIKEFSIAVHGKHHSIWSVYRDERDVCNSLLQFCVNVPIWWQSQLESRNQFFLFPSFSLQIQMLWMLYPICKSSMHWNIETHVKHTGMNININSNSPKWKIKFIGSHLDIE